MDSAFAQLSATTGAGASLNGVVSDAARGAGAMGVGMQEAAAATGTLYTQMSQFSSMTADTQANLVQTTAALERLGISGAQTAQNMNLATNAFGYSGDEAAALQDDMARTAMAVGMPPAEMAAGFAKAAPQLAQFGKQGTEIFKRMAVASKELGVSMDTLLGVANLGDTFESSTVAAGNLNAMLGGDLVNGMELMHAEGDEAVRMLLQAVDASGRSWDSMNKFEKKQLAATVGITDMTQAAALFGGGLKGFDDAQRKAEENAVSQAEMEEAMAASVSVMEKVKLMFSQLAVGVAPLIAGMQWVLNGIMRINDAFGGVLLPVLIGGIAAFWMIYKVMTTVAAAQTAYATITGTVAAAEVAGAAAKQTSSLANMAVGATAPIAAAGEVALGTAATAGIGPQLLFALAIGLVAVGLGMMAISIAAVVWAFVVLIKAMMEAPMAAVYAAGALVVLGVAVAILAGIFSMLAPIAPIAAASMIILGYGLMFLVVPMLIFSSAFAILAAALTLLTGDMASSMMSVGLALIPFAFSLMLAAPAMYLAGIVLGPAVWTIGLALFLLGLGIKHLVKYSKKMPFLGLSLAQFAIGLLAAAFPLYLAAAIVGPGVIILGIALLSLGIAIKILAKNRKKMPELAMALAEFAWKLLIAAPALYLAGMTIGPAAALLGIGLVFLGFGLRAMEGTEETMQAIATHIVPMAHALMQAGPALLAAGFLMYLAGVPFFVGSLLIAAGMHLLADPLMQFAEAIALLAPHTSSLIPLAMALMVMGWALPVFGLGLFLLGLFASLPFVGTGLGVLTEALFIFADAMNGIPTEKAVALGQIFEGLAKLTNMTAIAFGLLMFAYALYPLSWGMNLVAAAVERVGFEQIVAFSMLLANLSILGDLGDAGENVWGIAFAIWALGEAIGNLPVRKMFLFQMVREGVVDLGEMSAKMKPESVEAAAGLVDEAQRYMEVQQEMRFPFFDPFLRVFEASQKAATAKAEAAKAQAEAGEGGQDVVLVLNERELGRAVEAILNKKMNLAVS